VDEMVIFLFFTGQRAFLLWKTTSTAFLFVEMQCGKIGQSKKKEKKDHE